MQAPVLPRPLSSMGEAALHYARTYGWEVFPLARPILLPDGSLRCSCNGKSRKCVDDFPSDVGKHPSWMCPHGFKDGTNDLAQIEAWWRKDPLANIGIVAGKRETVLDPVHGELHIGSGLVIVDIDVKPYADGRYQYEILQDKVGKLPETPTVLTGSGGWQKYFLHPGPQYRVGNRQGLSFKLRGQAFDLQCIDIRGDGGYGILPDSLHRCGRRYRWEDELSPDDVPFAPLPPALYELITEGKGRAPMPVVPVDESLFPPAERRIRRAAGYLKRLPGAVSGEGGGVATFSAAMDVVRGFAVPSDQAVELMLTEYNPRCVPPWSESDIFRKVEEALVKGRRPMGYKYRLDKESSEPMAARTLPRPAVPELPSAAVPANDAAPASEPPAQVAPVADAAPASVEGLATPIVDEAAVEPVEALVSEPVEARDTHPERSLVLVVPAPARELPDGDDETSDDDGGDDGNGGDGDGGGGGGGGGDDEPDEAGPRWDHTFEQGDQMEVARVALGMLQRGGRHLIWEEQRFWRYEPRLGVWEEKSDEWIEGQIQRLAHNPVAGDDRPLQLSYSAVVGARKALRNELVRAMAEAERVARRVRVEMQGDLARIPHHWSFARAWKGMAFRNGFLRIHLTERPFGGRVEFSPGPHPEAMARFRIEADYDPNLPRPDLLRQFFDVLFGDVTDPDERQRREWLLQEFAGAGLGGVATKFQKALFLSGKGGNGKSQVLQLLRGIFPAGAVSSIPLNEWGRPFQLQGMIGKAANFCDEIADKELYMTNKIKSVISGDPVYTDQKNRDGVSFVPVACQILSGNAMPGTTDHTNGFWDRMMILPLTTKIRNTSAQQRDIGNILVREELGAIVQWAIEGLVRLLQQGRYTEPEGSRLALIDWRNEADVIRHFLLQLPPSIYDELGSRKGYGARDLYREYRAWMSHQPNGDRDAMSETMFGRRAEDSGFLMKRKAHTSTRYYAEDAYKQEYDRQSKLASDLDAELRAIDESERAKAHADPDVFVEAPVLFGEEV